MHRFAGAGALARGTFWRLFIATAASACAGSGQTGSPSCATPPLSCVCASFTGRMAVAADVVAFDGSQIELLVTEDPPSRPERLLPLPGNRVVGPLWNPTECGDFPSAEFHPGDHVVVLPGATDMRCAPSPICDAGYDADTWAAVPPAYDLRAPNLVVVPTADTVDFGDGTLVPRDSLRRLLDPYACEQTYPGPPAPPCHDVIETSSLRCSMATPSPAAPLGGAGVFAGVAALLVLARRRWTRGHSSRNPSKPILRRLLRAAP